MDIRVATYNSNTTVSTVSRPGSPFATAYVQNASNSNPVTPAAPVNAIQNQTAANPSDGYTDSVRGSLVNILA